MCWWFGYIDNSFHGIPVSNTRVWIHIDVSVVRSNSFSHFILSVSLSFRSDSDSIHNRFSVYIYEWAENETGIQTHSTTLLVACSTLFIRFALASSCIKMLLLLLWLFVTYFLRSICSTIHSVGLLPFCYPWNEYTSISYIHRLVLLSCAPERASPLCVREIYTHVRIQTYIYTCTMNIGFNSDSLCSFTVYIWNQSKLNGWQVHKCYSFTLESSQCNRPFSENVCENFRPFIRNSAEYFFYSSIDIISVCYFFICHRIRLKASEFCRVCACF